MKILLVEDDQLLAASAEIGLSQRDCSVDWVQDIAAADNACANQDYDCILLDLGLPGGDGITLLRDLRARKYSVPVIIVTARDTIEERIAGLDVGADDYIVKPYSLDELAARIRAVTRRLGGRASPLLESANICVDPLACTVSLAGKPVALSATEFKLLVVLMENAGRLLQKQKLEDALGGDTSVSSNVLEVHVHHLRQKLGAETIKTVRGMGYIFPK